MAKESSGLELTHWRESDSLVPREKMSDLARDFKEPWTGSAHKTGICEKEPLGEDMRSHKMKNINNRRQYYYYIIFLCLLFIGIAVRYIYLDTTSGDWGKFLNPWTTILQTQGFSSFKKTFSNYNYLYLYLLLLILQIPISRLYALKLLSIIFDFLLGFGAYKILRERVRGFSPMLGGLLVFLCPTTIINSAGWGQCDSIHTTFLIFSIYFLLKRKGFLAALSFSISFCIKLQSVFILPVFGIIFFNRVLRDYYNIKLSYLFLPPLCYIICGLPTLVAGRPLWEILSFKIYFKQLILYSNPTLNAPTLYNFFSTKLINTGTPSNLLVLFIGIVISILCLFFIRYYKKFPQKFFDSFLLLTQFLSILSIFLLPRMHERYFYFCDIMSIIIFMWYRRPILVIASLLIIFSSMISYNFFFPFMPAYFTMKQASLFMLSGLILTGYALWSNGKNFRHPCFRDTDVGSLQQP